MQLESAPQEGIARDRKTNKAIEWRCRRGGESPRRAPQAFSLITADWTAIAAPSGPLPRAPGRIAKPTFLLPNAYVFIASGNSALLSIYLRKHDLTIHAPCSAWSKMLQDTSASLLTCARGAIQAIHALKSVGHRRRNTGWGSRRIGSRAISLRVRAMLEHLGAFCSTPSKEHSELSPVYSVG